MQYISREDYCKENCGKENREGYKTCKNCGMLNIPTADVQPVRCGEWEKKSSVGVFRCSLCQHIFMLGADEIDEYHFCPNCGADMRGDENG
jgi:hypothetical protein